MQQKVEPSLVRVLATTLHLWLRRRVLRVPDGAKAGTLRWVGLTAAVLVVAGAAGALAAGLAGAKATPRPQQHHAARPNPTLAMTITNEQTAAAWVVSQVAAGTPVGCDPTMCGYLQAAGLAAGQQVTFQPGAGLPGAAKVIVATPLVRGQAAAALASQAADVIASFGSGQEQVQVRTTTTATYLATVHREVAADMRAGRALAAKGRMHMSAAAQRELVSGLADPRLIFVLGRLVAARPLYVAAFGDAGPGASWPALLRSVTIGRLVHGTGRHQVNLVGAMLSLLHRLPASYRPAITQQRLPTGAVLLTIEFPAPSPL